MQNCKIVKLQKLQNMQNRKIAKYAKYAFTAHCLRAKAPRERFCATPLNNKGVWPKKGSSAGERVISLGLGAPPCGLKSYVKIVLREPRYA